MGHFRVGLPRLNKDSGGAPGRMRFKLVYRAGYVNTSSSRSGRNDMGRLASFRTHWTTRLPPGTPPGASGLAGLAARLEATEFSRNLREPLSLNCHVCPLN